MFEEKWKFHLVFLFFTLVGLWSMSDYFHGHIKGGDDLGTLTEARTIRVNPQLAFDFARTSDYNAIATYYQPFFYLFFGALSFFFEDNNSPYLLTGYIIHIINSVLFYILLKKLIHDEHGSRIGSLLFLIFPWNISTITWISAIIHPLTVFFAFMILISYDEFLKSTQKNPLSTLIFYVLGCMTKQQMYLFFIVMLTYKLFVFEKYKVSLSIQSLKKIIWSAFLLSPYIMISLVFVMIQLYKYKLGWIYQIHGGMLLHGVIFYRLLDFLKEFFWPFATNFFFAELLLLSISFTVFLLSAFNKNKIYLFGAIWIVCFGLISMTVHLRSIESSIRYIYAISPGFFILAAEFSKSKRHSELVYLLFVVYILRL